MPAHIHQSFLNSLHTLPPTPELLLPQTHPIIPSTHRQHIPGHTPANPPHHHIKIQRLALPRTRIAHLPTRRQRPNPHRMILRRRRNIRLRQRRRRPRHIPHPVRVPLQRTQHLIRSRRGAKIPKLDEIIAPTRRKPPHHPGRRARLPRHQLPRQHRRGPTDAIGAQTAVRIEHDMTKRVVLESEHTDVAVAAGGRQVAARFGG